MNLGSVSPNLWRDFPVFLIGGGPSLKGFDFSQLKGKGFVVAINDAFLALPWADALYSEDKIWFNARAEKIRAFKGGKYFAIQPESFKDPFHCTLLKRSRNIRLSDDLSEINIGGNSGYGALNLAYLAGAQEIILLGYDLNPTKNNNTHWHEGYSWFDQRKESLYYPRWAKQYEDTVHQLAQKRVTVVNTNYSSAITCFPFAPLNKWV